MGRHNKARQIEKLDPKRDHAKIYHLIFGYEFPWDMTCALELALYQDLLRAKHLGATRQDRENKRTQKRYDDTALIVSEMAKWGYDSERGREALRKMYQAHSRFAISNDNYLTSSRPLFTYQFAGWTASAGVR